MHSIRGEFDAAFTTARSSFAATLQRAFALFAALGITASDAAAAAIASVRRLIDAASVAQVFCRS
jgi:hypothetical protein